METIYKVDRKNAAYCYPLLEPSDLEEIFFQLAQQWRQETGMMSLVTKMVMHPAYQRIIGMGQPVVPLILRELDADEISIAPRANASKFSLLGISSWL